MAHCIDNVQNAKNDLHQLMSFFVANGRSPDGLSCLCKKCKKIESRAHYEKVRADPVK